MKKTGKTTKVPTSSGDRRVRILAKRGVWAITPRIVSGGTTRGVYSLTHLPTGLCVQDSYDDMTMALARKLLRLLPIDFAKDAPDMRGSKSEGTREFTMEQHRADDFVRVVREFFAKHEMKYGAL